MRSIVMCRRSYKLAAGLLAAGLALLFMVPAWAQQAAPSAATFDCIIESQQTVKLASPVAGVVGEVMVERGDVVQKGQVVAKLRDGVEKANLALARAKATNDYALKSARAKYEFLRAKHGRAETLIAKGFASQEVFDESLANARAAEEEIRRAEADTHIAQLEVEQAEEVLNQRIITSPLDGVVTEVLLHPGEHRNDQSPIMTLAQVDPLRVEVFVPTAYYGQIRTDTTAAVEPEEPVGGSYDANVTVVDQVMDAASGTFGVRLALPNPDRRLPAGLRCKIRFPNLTVPSPRIAAK